MTPQINFSNPITATTTDGGTINFALNEKIPGQASIALALQSICDASQQRGSEIKKYECLEPRGGLDRSKLKNHGMTIGNY